MSDKAVIRKLTIDRFRGIERLEWRPASGMNVILGGGDVGKTTVLEAIALLLSPTNNTTVSESDYWLRQSDLEFVIEAVMTLPDSTNISTQQKFAWPWNWDGENAVLPEVPEDGSDDQPAPGDPVYRVRVRGTPELELLWEIVQPSEEPDHFAVAVRRKVGLVRLSGDDRNDRDLRLVYGSALDRLFADGALRARIGRSVTKIDFDDALGEKGIRTIDALGERLKRSALPSELKLGLTTTRGLSIGALTGLLAEKSGVSLPLASWGTGTRRMAALEVASSTEKGASVTTIDEIERGLEPYRLRKLIETLYGLSRQTFVTTHSPVAITCAKEAHLWYLDNAGGIGALPHEKIEKQQERDPETFLSKVAVIAEGETEVGFLRCLLERALAADPLDYGVRVCHGQGNSSTLTLLETLSSAGLLFAGLADDEGKDSGRWQALKQKLGDRLLQWSGGCTEQAVISAIPTDKLSILVDDEDGELCGKRLRTLAVRLSIEDKRLSAIEEALDTQKRTLCEVIIEAATGNKAGAPSGLEKAWERHGRDWFKTERGGRELAKKMISSGGWEKIGPVIQPLIDSILEAAGRPVLDAPDP